MATRLLRTLCTWTVAEGGSLRGLQQGMGKGKGATGMQHEQCRRYRGDMQAKDGM